MPRRLRAAAAELSARIRTALPALPALFGRAFAQDPTSAHATIPLPPAAVPEPEVWVMLVAGIALLLVVRRRRPRLAGEDARRAERD